MTSNRPQTSAEARKEKEIFLKSARKDIENHLKAVGFKNASLYDVDAVIWQHDCRELRAYVKHPEIHYDRELYVTAQFATDARGRWKLKDADLTVVDRKGETLIAFARTAKDVAMYI